MTSVISLGRVSAPAAPLGLAEGEVSREEFDRVFERWVRRQAEIEEQLGKHFGVLQKWLALGVATCDQLQRYNNRALGVNLFSQRVRKLMVDAGLEGVPPVPRPMLFGSSATSKFDAGIETFEVNLSCDEFGFAESAVRANVCAARIQPPGQLGALTLATAGAWAIVFLSLGGLGLLGASAWRVFQRGMPSNVFNQMQKEIRAQTFAQDLRRLEAADDCYERALRNLPTDQRGNLETLRQLKRECDDRAERLVPDRDVDLERPSGPMTLARALLLGGLAITGTVVALRFAKSSGGGGAPRAQVRREGFRERRRRRQREMAEARRMVGAEAAEKCAEKKGTRFRRCIEQQIRAEEARS